jgi:Flp pilus assembly protein CpaB
MAVPVEAPQAVAGQIRTGDSVDVFAAFETITPGEGANRPVVKTLMQNVLVLRGAGGEEESKGGDEEQVVLRVSANSAAELAFASENGKVWLAVRPGAGAEDPKKELVTLESLLLGKRPQLLDREGGDR